MSSAASSSAAAIPGTTPTVGSPKKPLKASAFETKIVKAGTGDGDRQGYRHRQYSLVQRHHGRKDRQQLGLADRLRPQRHQLLAGLRKSLIGSKIGAQMLSAMPPADQFAPGAATKLSIISRHLDHGL